MQFIRNAFREHSDTRMLEAVLGIADSLYVPTVAEGVETAEQLDALRSRGCDIAQGYYFSKPVPPEQYEFFIEQRMRIEEEIDPIELSHRMPHLSYQDYTYDALHDSLTGLYNNTAFRMLVKDADRYHTALLIAEVTEATQILSEQGQIAAEAIIEARRGLPEALLPARGSYLPHQQQRVCHHHVTGGQQHTGTGFPQDRAHDTGDTSKLVWFTVPKATGKPVWLSPYITDNLNVRVISYNEPIYWKGRFVGVIGIELDYSAMAEEVNRISLPNMPARRSPRRWLASRTTSCSTGPPPITSSRMTGRPWRWRTPMSSSRTCRTPSTTS